MQWFDCRYLSEAGICTKVPYIHYIIRYPWTVVRGNGAEIEHHS